jgi:peroxiredoxin Q/BCP
VTTVVALAQGIVALIFRREREQRALKVGDPAPAFSLPGSDDRNYRLEDYRGRSVVVLAWFPKAFTGG